jgi:DNA polymerase type B, organellar and viral
MGILVPCSRSIPKRTTGLALVGNSTSSSSPLINVYDTAVRAWVEPKQPRRPPTQNELPWRAIRFDERILVFDTETTTDFTQRLLFGVFRCYVQSELFDEGLFLGDSVDKEQTNTARAYAESHGLPVYTRAEFVENIFYREVYVQGSLCVGFNLPFDLSRIAGQANPGKGKHRRSFRLKLSFRVDLPDLRIESISSRAAFIRFAPKKTLQDWERPLFQGRFLDLSTLTSALTGEKYTLRRAAFAFKTHHKKSKVDSLGTITNATIDYGRNDVLVTWELFEKLKAEYLKYPFASLANERNQAAGSVPFTRLYSTASVAKAVLKLMGFSAPLDRMKELDPRAIGWVMSAYFGGRSEVRTRRVDVPVRVVDFTSMYPTVFILMDLQELLAAHKGKSRDVTEDVRKLLDDVTLEELYDPTIWRKLRCIVKLKPNGDTLPVRMRLRAEDPYAIALTPFSSSASRWYTLADVIAAKLLGTTIAAIEEAVEFYADGRQGELHRVEMLDVKLDPRKQIFKTVVEERQRNKDDNAALAQALKILANSGAYGIYAEVNVAPSAERKAEATRSVWYSDIGPIEGETHDERPGSFFNPILASLVTGAARLALAMAEAEVALRGGTFAFCDTDSLAIIGGESAAQEVPCLSDHDVKEIVTKFNRLNPYDDAVVPSLLKLEYEGLPSLRCWAVSAKRYVLFTRDDRDRLRIVKASESGLGAALGRTESETIAKLARRMWLGILVRELRIRHEGITKQRLDRLTDFNLPMRRALPIAKPHVYSARGFKILNRRVSYDFKIKPFSFLQAVTPALEFRKNAAQPIAPFERDLLASKKLPWTDYKTGTTVALDWEGNFYAGTVPVSRFDEFIDFYRRHPESKAAGPDGMPADEETNGVLERLRLTGGSPRRIGKEVDRLDEDEEFTLDRPDPAEYVAAGATLVWALRVLAPEPASKIASQLGMSERRFRDIRQGRVKEPQARHKRAIIALARSQADASPESDG